MKSAAGTVPSAARWLSVRMSTSTAPFCHRRARRLRVEALEPAARLRKQLVDRHGAGVEGAAAVDPVRAGEAPFVSTYGAGSKRRVFCQ